MAQANIAMMGSFGGTEPLRRKKIEIKHPIPLPVIIVNFPDAPDMRAIAIKKKLKNPQTVSSPLL
jgi:hypothetical protein